MNYSMAECSRRLRELRAETPGKPTQGDVAAAIGVSNERVSQWERGYSKSIPIEDAFHLAEYYHVTLDYLFGRSSEKNPYAAEITRYTGLSSRSADALHNLHEAMPGLVDILSEAILSNGFPSLLHRARYLRKRAIGLSSVEADTQLKTQEAIDMKARHRFRMQVDADKEYGMTVIIKGIEALHYEAGEVLRMAREIIFQVCEIREAEAAWQAKSRAEVEAAKQGFRRDKSAESDE